MADYKPLNIPARDHTKGMYILCTKCDRNISDKCMLTGKRKSTCKHGDAHRFQSKTYLKELKRSVPVKTYDKDFRDPLKFKEAHPLEVKKFLASKRRLGKKRGLPILLADALRMYADWLADIDPFKESREGEDPPLLPAQQRKKNKPKYISGEITNCVSFKDSQPDYDHLKVTDVDEYNVGLFHSYLKDYKDYANRTYNNKMESMNAAYKQFMRWGYKIEVNPFSTKEVKRLDWTGKDDMVKIKDFAPLLKTITQENGIIFEWTSEGVKRKSLYRDWLTDYFELALYTGGRPEDVISLKVKDVKEKHIEITDHKNSKEKKVVHWVVRSKEFDTLYTRLQSKYNLSPESYLIEPEDARRETLANHASKAFSAYWKKYNTGYWARLYSLRKTHATLMVMRHGKSYEGIFGMHQNISMTKDSYANFETMIGQYAGKSMLG